MDLLEKYLNLHPNILPRLSPDGKKIAFLKNDGQASQVWVKNIDESKNAAKLTDNSGGVLILDWYPDGQFIAFAADLNGDEKQGYYLVSADGKRTETLLEADGSYHIWGGFSPDGKYFSFAANRFGTFDFDIFIVEIETRSINKIYDGGGAFYPVSWHPQGNGLILLKIVAADANEVCYLDLNNLKIETLLAPAEPSYHNFFSWKPDASGFYLATNAERDFGGIGFFDFLTKTFSWHHTSDCDVENAALSPSGNYLSWYENREGYSKLFTQNLETKDITSSDKFPDGVIYEIKWAKNADKLAVEITSPKIIGDIWIYEPKEKSVGLITDSQITDKTERCVFPQTLRFSSFDGETVFGLLYEPDNSNDLPVIIHFHGGPAMQARPKFDAFHQFLLSHGFAILDLNYRGSTGFGKRFMRLDNKLSRKDAVRDIASAVEFIRKQPKLNAEKIALLGESYGGFMVLAGLVEFPELFACGVDIVGVSDWLTALENTLPQLRAADAEEYGDINDEKIRQFLFDLSPINHIDKIKSPLLVIHGQNDPRVPVGQALEISEKLKIKGNEIELLIFDDEGHSITKTPNRLKSWRRITEFLQNHLIR